MRKYFGIVLSFCFFSIFSLPVYGVEFETVRVQETYSLLPTDVKATISAYTSGKNFRFRTDNIVSGSQIRICFNAENQISHIGISLFSDSEMENVYKEAYFFLENSLLNYILRNDMPAILKMAKERETSFFLHNKPLTNESRNLILFSNIVKSTKFSLNLDNFQFTASWNTLDGEKFAMKFPADINLLKGMDKGQLEKEFILQMKVFAASNILIPQKQYFRSDQKVGGIYIQKGNHFETDDFRSDVFLTKKNNNEYLPVYSNKFPVESFANLFTCNLQSTIDAHLTLMLYGNKTEEVDIKLRKMQAFLSENNETFFGLQSNEDQVLKATIVYFNPTYRYIHMLVTEVNKSVLFGNAEKIIKTSLYLYIPQANFIKEVVFE